MPTDQPSMSEIERGRILMQRVAPFIRRYTYTHQLFTLSMPVIRDPRVPVGEPREVEHARPSGQPLLVLHPADADALLSATAARAEHLGQSGRERLWEPEVESSEPRLWSSPA